MRLLRPFGARHGIVSLIVLIILGVTPVLPPFAGAQPAAVPGFGFVASGGADFAAMRGAGAGAVKLVADWSAIEATRGQPDWTELDASVRAATRAGLSVTVVLAYTPKWASLATGPDLDDRAVWSRQPARRIEDWQAFVGRAVQRYKASVRDWQVWTTLSLPVWRGTPKDYVNYLTAARTGARAADAQSRIALATPYGLDLVWVNRMQREAGASFDTVSLAPRGMDPDDLLRPLRVLREQVLSGRAKRIWLEWDPRSSGERAGWSGQLLKVAAIARALGVDRVDWAMDPSLASSALQLFAANVGMKAPVGYLASDRALGLVFGETAPAAVAWSADGTGDLELRPGSVTVITATGESRTLEVQGSVALRPEPVILIGLDDAVAADARAQREKGAPLPPGGRDFSDAAQVQVRLARTNTEEGLYNMRFRGRRNGALDVVEVGGVEAVRTNAGKDIVYAYFDVDDSFIYFVNGRHGVEITVEVHGASAPRQLGFNLFYDSMRDYRFTEWQWVEAKDGWVTYTFRLPDAAFANTWGWDFAVNAVGNRKEDLTIRTVTVRKSASR